MMKSDTCFCFCFSNRVHCVFGQVLSGEDIIRTVEALDVDAKSRPKKTVKILNCGELVLQLKSKCKGALCYYFDFVY